MASRFLTDEQLAAYGRYGTDLVDRGVLERFFFLDDADLELIAKRRGDHNRLGFAVQLVTLRHVGVFLADPLEAPQVVVDYVAVQVGADDPSCVQRYTERAHATSSQMPRKPIARWSHLANRESWRGMASLGCARATGPLS